jgi:hypothetical protein
VRLPVVFSDGSTLRRGLLTRHADPSALPGSLAPPLDPEIDDVNRPFGAFGALLALSTLAMFAVSSPQRCTTVQARSSVQERRSEQETIRFTRSMPSQQVSASSMMIPSQAESLECDGGEDDSWWDAGPTGEELSTLSRVGGRAAPMTSARIQCTENTDATWRRAATDDDVSHACRTVELPAEGPADIESDWLATFQSLVVPTQLRPAPQSGAVYRSQGGSPGSIALSAAISISLMDRGVLCGGVMQARSFVNAFMRWMLQRADQLAQDYGMRWADAGGKIIGWDEYAELIDRALADGSTSTLAKRTSERFRSVRSSGWLRHSAASSLYQLGLFLQAAGLELSGAALQ